MSSRCAFHRGWLWSVVLVVLSAGPVAAQPPSPLELVRGLRENGQVDLALEFLKEIENKPLTPEDKAAILLERAKCLLDASEDEPDEGTRLGMIAEAKEGLNTFLVNHSKHPRAVEALLAVAKLTSVDARLQLNKARRMDISDETPAAKERDEAKQKIEAAKARPLFLLASTRYADASKILRAKLEDKTLDPITRKTLEREAFEADLASGVNQFNIAETYLRPTANEGTERNKYLEQAKTTFNRLADGPTNNRTVWIAKAWIAEVIYEQNDFNAAAKAVEAILRAGVLEAEDGKRLARYFQVSRNFRAALGELTLIKLQNNERELRTWLGQFGNTRKPTPEVYTIQYYLALALQLQAEIANPIKDPTKPPPLGQTARKQMEEAEKLYRALAQGDNDYTARAGRKRMAVVRRLLGEADQPVAFYDTFEKAQMASLIQLSKLAQAEAMPVKMPGDEAKKEAEIAKRRLTTIALLERSRELATPQDNPADVTDVYLRLIYFYHLTEQPYQAAVLGEFVARTLKTTGGKASLAGLWGMNGYMIAGENVKIEDNEARIAARKADRDHAMALARFLDEKFPNDNSTDAARHRLASMLVADKKLMDAFDVLVKVRPSYSQITGVRLLEGYVASQLVTPLNSPLTKEKKAEIYKRAVADLVKVAKPPTIASEEDVRGYLTARCRLASLLFAQGRADPASEAANPGAAQALVIAQSVINEVPTFDCLNDGKGAAKKLNLDGMEMNLLALDTYARAVYLHSRALTEAGKLPEASQTLDSTITAIRANGSLVTDQLKVWAAGRGDLIDPKKEDKEENRDPPDVAAQKTRVAELAKGVDKTRVEVILSGFRLQVKQGKAADAEAMLDLMVKAGGTVEDSLPVLELMGREMAVQMAVYRKEGKKAEADALKSGLAVLLKKITTAKNLPPSSVLFVGQTLQVVGENDKAIEILKKVPTPAFADWDKKRVEDFPDEVRGQLINQTRDYATAQLFIARALRESKKFDDSEKMLLAIIGTNEKPGWGSGRLFFRKELGTVYEDRDLLEQDPKKANELWGKGLQVWTTLVAIQRNRIASAKDASEEQLKSYRNAYADAYFDRQRCFLEANQDLLTRAKSPPARFQKTYDEVAKGFVDMEKQIPAAEFQVEVQHRYVELLDKYPQVKNTYKAAGGKFFLEKLPLP